MWVPCGACPGNACPSSRCSNFLKCPGGKPGEVEPVPEFKPEQLDMDDGEDTRKCRLAYSASMPRLRYPASAGADFWRKWVCSGGDAPPTPRNEVSMPRRVASAALLETTIPEASMGEAPLACAVGLAFTEESDHCLLEEDVAPRPPQQHKRPKANAGGSNSTRRFSAPPARRSRSTKCQRQRWSHPARGHRAASREKLPSFASKDQVPELLSSSLAAAVPPGGLHGSDKSLPRPPSSRCWDWPLTRHEKKARVLLIDKNVLMMDRKSLQDEIEVLRSLETPWG